MANGDDEDAVENHHCIKDNWVKIHLDVTIMDALPDQKCCGYREEQVLHDLDDEEYHHVLIRVKCDILSVSVSCNHPHR